MPWIVVRLPDDYFVKEKRVPLLTKTVGSPLSILFLILKNCLAVILLLAGIVMLVTPGQGLLTILIGVLMLDFPGKYRVERWMVRIKPVLTSINWLRRRKAKNELKID